MMVRKDIDDVRSTCCGHFATTNHKPLDARVVEWSNFGD
jgi:hypothetical protein